MTSRRLGTRSRRPGARWPEGVWESVQRSRESGLPATCCHANRGASNGHTAYGCMDTKSRWWLPKHGEPPPRWAPAPAVQGNPEIVGYRRDATDERCAIRGDSRVGSSTQHTSARLDQGATRGARRRVAAAGGLAPAFRRQAAHQARARHLRVQRAPTTAAAGSATVNVMDAD